MILNKFQADAVYSALNNIGAAIHGRIEVTSDIEVKVLTSGCIQIWDSHPDAKSGFECFSHQEKFAIAYDL